jgi:hypothetical protein
VASAALVACAAAEGQLRRAVPARSLYDLPAGRSACSAGGVALPGSARSGRVCPRDFRLLRLVRWDFRCRDWLLGSLARRRQFYRFTLSVRRAQYSYQSLSISGSKLFQSAEPETVHLVLCPMGALRRCMLLQPMVLRFRLLDSLVSAWL